VTVAPLHGKFGRRHFERKSLKEIAIRYKPSSDPHGAKDWQQLNSGLRVIPVSGLLLPGEHDVTLL